MKKRYQEDLEYFLNLAEQKRGKELDKEYPKETMHLDFYFNHSKEELYSYIKDFTTSHPITNDYDFYYLMNCIIKYMSGTTDAHTRILKIDNDNSFPISLKAIDDKIYIIKCNDKNLIFSELLKINGIDINLIINEIEKCTAYGAYGWFLYKLHFNLINKNILLSLPSIDSKCKYIEYTTSKGNIKFEVNRDYSEEKNNIKNINFKQIEIRENILIFKYPKCNNKYAPDIKKIKLIISNNKIQNFVLDLRGNFGGQSSIIEPLIKYLKHSKLNLFTVVNRTVFSSGRWAAIYMKKIGSKIVGQDIGTPINCFGYNFGSGELPNTKFKFNFSRVYWYENKNHIMKGIYTKKELHKKPKEFFKPKFLKIDYYVNLTINDYKLNKDVTLDKCCEWINKNI